MGWAFMCLYVTFQFQYKVYTLHYLKRQVFVVQFSGISDTTFYSLVVVYHIIRTTLRGTDVILKLVDRFKYL